MRRNLLSFAAVAAFGFASLTASGQAVVISQDFEGSASLPAGWTTLDVDGDGTTWKIGGEEFHNTGSSKRLAVSLANGKTQDNWLISPAIAVPNEFCSLQFEYAEASLECYDDMEVLISETGTAVDDFISFAVKSNIEPGYDDDVEIYNFSSVLSQYAGKTIYIAIRHTNPASSSYALTVDNFKVYNALGPTVPTGFSVVAGANGVLEATLSWTNPSRTANGEALEGLAIDIYRDGEFLTSVTEGVVPGESMSYVDRTALNGRHSYTICASNAAGRSERLSWRSVYVGEDIPAAVKDAVAIGLAGKVVLSWTAPSAGANKGYIDVSNLTYEVWRSVDGGVQEKIAEGLTATSYTDTPESGKMCSYQIAAVSAGGPSDVSDVMNSTSAIVYPQTSADLLVGKDGVVNNRHSTRLPIGIDYRNSATQVIYTPEDFNFIQGKVDHLVYKSSLMSSTDYQATVQVYMTVTDVADLTDWVEVADADLVYLGTLAMPQGRNDVEIALTKPFDYTGGNVVVTMIHSSERTVAYSERFFTSETGTANRSRSATSYSTAIELNNFPAGSGVSYIPMTRFIIGQTSNVGQLSGVVTNGEGGAAVAGATVTPEGYASLAVTTDAAGRYEFRYLPADVKKLAVTVNGFADATVDVEIVAGESKVKDIVLAELDNYSITGRVLTSDTNLPAGGAVVALTGYTSATAVADASGVWTIPAVYSNRDYTLSISYPLYDVYRVELSREATGGVEDLGDVVVERSLIAPYAVGAEVSADGSAVGLEWADPLSRTNKAGWKSVGDVSEQKSTGGDYYYASYNIGHGFNAEDLVSSGMDGLSVSEVRTYIACDPSKAVFTAKVWREVDGSFKELAAAPFAAADITAGGGWVTARFAEPVELHAGESYRIGVRIDADNQVSSPFGTASSSYVSGKNNLKWDDENPYVSNSFSAWCIEALCSIPGTEVDLADNEDAPACEYAVYRLSTDGGDWEKLTATPLKEAVFTDAGWATLPLGSYRYGVAAVYQNGESLKALSPVLERNVDSDAGVTAIISPMRSTDVQTSAEVKVEVANLGERPISNFPVRLMLDGTEVLTKTYDGTLNKGQKVEFVLGMIELSKGTHKLVASTALEGDGIPSNDAVEMVLPNNDNVELVGFRWNAYGNAGVMKIQTNDPEGAQFIVESTPHDGLVISGEYVDGKFYGYTATWYSAPMGFFSLDPRTWVLTSYTEQSQEYILDMAYDYKSSTMYGLYPGDTSVFLVTIDLTSGVSTSVADLGQVFRALACDLDGQLYAISSDGGFYRLDVDGEGDAAYIPTFVGDTGVGNVVYLQSMAFDHNSGRLFWAHTNDDTYGAIYEIDPQTGRAEFYGKTLFNGSEDSEIVGLHTVYDRQDGIESVRDDGGAVASSDVVDVYNLQGVLLMRGVSRSDAMKALEGGVYLFGREKVIVTP